MQTIDDIRFNRICKYIDARKKGNLEECLSVIADDIDFNSQRDGKYVGKTNFERYLKKTKFEGTWGRPEKTNDGFVVKGKVKILLIPISVRIDFRFNDRNEINYARIGKA